MINTIKTQINLSITACLAALGACLFIAQPAQAAWWNSSDDDVAQIEELIEAVSVVTVSSPSLCQSDKPWVLGEKEVNSDDSLPTGGCFALKVTMAQNADVYIFNQSDTGQMSRLLPSSCNVLGTDSGQQVRSGQQLHLPQTNGQNGVLILDEKTGVERFHIVAVEGEDAKEAFEKRIEDIPDVCSGEFSTRETVAGFEEAMLKLNKKTKGHVHWKTVQFYHH